MQIYQHFRKVASSWTMGYLPYAQTFSSPSRVPCGRIHTEIIRVTHILLHLFPPDWRTPLDHALRRWWHWLGAWTIFCLHLHSTPEKIFKDIIHSFTRQNFNFSPKKHSVSGIVTVYRHKNFEDCPYAFLLCLCVKAVGSSNTYSHSSRRSSQ